MSEKPTLKRACHDTHDQPRPDDCQVCWRAVHVRFYQRRWGLPETGEYEEMPRSPVGHIDYVAIPARPPCKYAGDGDNDLTALEVIELQLNPLMKWLRCDAGHGIVCPCGECKTCLDYVPADDSVRTNGEGGGSV